MFQVNNLSVGLINHLKRLRNAIKEDNRAICIELQEYYYEFVPDTQWQLPVRGSKNKEVGTLQQALMSLLVKVLVGMTSNFDLHFFKIENCSSFIADFISPRFPIHWINVGLSTQHNLRCTDVIKIYKPRIYC